MHRRTQGTEMVWFERNKELFFNVGHKYRGIRSSMFPRTMRRNVKFRLAAIMKVSIALLACCLEAMSSDCFVVPSSSSHGNASTSHHVQCRTQLDIEVKHCDKSHPSCTLTYWPRDPGGFRALHFLGVNLADFSPLLQFSFLIQTLISSTNK